MSTTGSFTNFEENISQKADRLCDVIPDNVRRPDQKFAVCSIVAPRGLNQKSEQLAIRIYGCAASLEEANAWASKIRAVNDMFDVFTLACHGWAVLPPDISKIDDVRYAESQIQSIRDDYISHLEGEKAAMVQRIENDRADKSQKAEKPELISA